MPSRPIRTERICGVARDKPRRQAVGSLPSCIRPFGETSHYQEDILCLLSQWLSARVRARRADVSRCGRLHRLGADQGRTIRPKDAGEGRPDSAGWWDTRGYRSKCRFVYGFPGVLPEVQCISIEPHPGNFCRLQGNVRSSSLSRCRLFHVALATKAALLELEAINTANTGTVRVHSNDQFATGHRITVAAISLDELMQYSRAIEITLLKIDVEGYELPVLDGLDWFGQHRPQHVLIEFSGYEARFSGKGREDLLSFFAAKGYVGYSVEGLPLAASDDPAEHNAWFRDARNTEKYAQTAM